METKNSRKLIALVQVKTMEEKEKQLNINDYYLLQ